MSTTSTLTEVAPQAPPASCMICTEDLWKTYDMGSEQVHALRGVDIRIERNEGLVLPEREYG